MDNRFTLRPAQWDDVEAVTEVIRHTLIADGDEMSAVTAEELENEWKSEGFDLEKDAWVVTDETGRAVGYEECTQRQAFAYYNGDGYVHPEFRGHGIGTALLQQVEARVREQMPLAAPDLRVYIRAGTNAGDPHVRAMFEGEGYSIIRHHWMMEIKLEAAPQITPLPAGIELRPFDAQTQAYLVFQAEDEAFQDHWGHVPGNYNNWKLRKLEREAFDPSLWYIAWEGDQIAGYAQTRYRNGIGWVGNLGVRRPWRKRGLGEALLLHAFNEFYKRDMPTVGLGVDASNPTGATRLYQKVGMHVAVEDVIYEKELRPGRMPEDPE